MISKHKRWRSEEITLTSKSPTATWYIRKYLEEKGVPYNWTEYVNKVGYYRLGLRIKLSERMWKEVVYPTLNEMVEKEKKFARWEHSVGSKHIEIIIYGGVEKWWR